MTASASLPLKGTVSLGEGVPADQARGLVISGSATSTFGVNCEFSIKDKKVIASGTCDLGKLELSGEVSIKITDTFKWEIKKWGPKAIAAATLTKQIDEGVFLDFSGS